MSSVVTIRFRPIWLCCMFTVANVSFFKPGVYDRKAVAFGSLGYLRRGKFVDL